jgi:uncharacterized protein
MYSQRIYKTFLFLLLSIISQLFFAMESEEKWNSRQLNLYKSTENVKEKDILQKIFFFKNNLNLAMGSQAKSLIIDKISAYKTQDFISYLSDEIKLEITKRLINVDNTNEITKSAKTIRSLASTNKIFYNLLNDLSNIKFLLKSIPVEDAYNLICQMKKMKVMKCGEMVQWAKNTNEKIENSRELYYAVRHREKPKIQKLLKNRNIDLNWINKNTNLTILIEVVYDARGDAINDYKEIIQMLLKAGANINGKNENGDTPLSCAAGSHCDLSILRILLKAGANLNSINNKGRTPLYDAICERRAESALMLIEAGANPNTIAGDDTPLLIAIYYHHHLKGLPEKLLPACSNQIINYKNRYGYTALWYAANYGKTKLSKMLLALGADPRQNKDILAQAAWHGNAELVTNLVKAGADINGKMGYCTPLMIAAEGGKEDIVQVLLDFHASVNEVTNIGSSALIGACKWGQTKIVGMLLNAGASVNQLDCCGQDALIHASEKGNSEIVSMLLNAKASVNQMDFMQKNALIHGATIGNPEIVRILMDADADVTHKDNKGWDASMWAANKGHLEAYNMLQQAKFIAWQKAQASKKD